MDAQVAYGFHHLRNEKPYLAQGPITNKIIYSSYSCTQGWFLTPCVSDPSLRQCVPGSGLGAEAKAEFALPIRSLYACIALKDKG
ncbi:hypothetical protein Golob_001691 [Gossypium lobatum]|uniref:Diacylglycerol kinase accessory domain-containing protein n=1 Tax=Gossypium lobatum TaxID=34289 RepID=A0A7J8NC62_9ROSI|nr:hypothetical protein [Gossypium lobatum]